MSFSIKNPLNLNQCYTKKNRQTKKIKIIEGPISVKAAQLSNIIDFDNIALYIDKKNTDALHQKDISRILTCIINKNNLYTKNSNFLFKKNDYEYIINENINSNTVDNINRVINNIKTEYICIYSDKINMIGKTIDLIIKNLSCNDNLSLASPLIQFFR